MSLIGTLERAGKGPQMSVRLVSVGHVRYLIHSAQYRLVGQDGLYWSHDDHKSRYLSPDDAVNATAVGQMLLDANTESVNVRYNETDLATPYPHHIPVPGYFWDPVQVLKSCACYRYQTEQSPGYLHSEAEAFIRALEQKAISTLKGYGQAKWGDPFGID